MADFRVDFAALEAMSATAVAARQQVADSGVRVESAVGRMAEAVGRSLRATMLAIAVLVLAACGTTDYPTQRHNYRAVPDAQLYEAIRAVPGVTDVELSYSTASGTANSYVGYVHASAGSDGEELVEKTIRILRKGRQDAYMQFRVLIPGQVAATPEFFSPEELDERYGPQRSAPE